MNIHRICRKIRIVEQAHLVQNTMHDRFSNSLLKFLTILFTLNENQVRGGLFVKFWSPLNYYKWPSPECNGRKKSEFVADSTFLCKKAKIFPTGWHFKMILLTCSDCNWVSQNRLPKMAKFRFFHLLALQFDSTTLSLRALCLPDGSVQNGL